jgi:N-acetyl-anhydromuramyl-L-alanine amidase AmpD
MQFIQKPLPPECYSKYTLEPEGGLAHFISGIDAHKISLANPDPFDVDLCINILKYYKFSAHVLMDRAGILYQLMPFNRRAWHAGESLLNGREKCNDWCLSVEIISTGQPYKGQPAYTEAQVLSTVRLFSYWKQNHPKITDETISGHDTVRRNAIVAGIKTSKGKTPDIKYDPGPNFPWLRIREAIK